jgi:glycine dehydrogenase
MSHESNDSFQSRHIGPDASERDAMLQVLAAPSLDALIEQTIPAGIRLPGLMDLSGPESEA